ncbi:hypothetical protein SSPO_095090 [Streptomyces antimycoticus]|uniref:Uncharacterized protein n=1 Tax=Streptomyces antimycoticus TaxID=68175 RepID=A0A499VB82_9ACTN|nr:hypothetical protein [Streptomyces antimycoticus]BBJ46791.1 hypothetical protein SSPO_095090 [Streptomyces antimycoticus]
MGIGTRWTTTTAAATMTLAGTLGLGLMAPMAQAAEHGPCYDGRCKITVSRPTNIAVDSHRFGFGKLRITHISSRSVKMSATTTGGARLSGSTSPGGTVRLNSLNIRVQSVSGHKAKLVLTRAS